MVAGSTVFATIVNPCSTSAFSPLIQSGGIVFKGIKNIEHQNQVQAFPFLLTPFFSISGAVKAIVVPLENLSSLILIISLPLLPQHFLFDAFTISAVANVPTGIASLSLI